MSNPQCSRHQYFPFIALLVSLVCGQIANLGFFTIFPRRVLHRFNSEPLPRFAFLFWSSLGPHPLHFSRLPSVLKSHFVFFGSLLFVTRHPYTALICFVLFLATYFIFSLFFCHRTTGYSGLLSRLLHSLLSRFIHLLILFPFWLFPSRLCVLCSTWFVSPVH